jgi:hypothetical protein
MRVVLLTMASFVFAGGAAQEWHDPHARWQSYLGVSLAVLCLIGSWRLQRVEDERERTHGKGDDL